MISNINYVKKALNELNTKAKKKFGQNFLIDENIVSKIAFNAVNESGKVIEIGPGLGALTEKLYAINNNIDAYEIDVDMYNSLQKVFSDINIYLEDFLKTDLNKYQDDELYICSNLPYYITTPILFKLFNAKLNIKKITVMVQKEVAERFKAKANTKEYGSLSIICQYLFKVEYLFTVKKDCFFPSPSVDSAVVSFTPIKERNFEYEEKLFDLVEKCFSKRRKTLNNNLKDFLDSDVINQIFQKLNFDRNIRSEVLTINDFINILGVIDDR